MKEASFNAKLISHDTLRIVLFALDRREEAPHMTLVRDAHTIEKLDIIRYQYQFGTNIYEVKAKSKFVLGHDYEVVILDYGRVFVDVTNATTFDLFDETYAYLGDDLGANYHKTETEFVLWAPLASRVLLKYIVEGQTQYAPMIREEKGIYRLKIQGNLDGAMYTYLVTNNGYTQEVIDPYGKASTQNAKQSVVINPKRLKHDLAEEILPPFHNDADAIIYETSVRDMTSDVYTSIKHKGQYLGLTEKGAKTKKGQLVGLDYIKHLGVTHVQLMPIYDFATIDETNPKESYNWGYDPVQYFVPEGSYASELSDPYSRIVDVKAMVRAFHQSGIRVNMDVVFNHVYQYEYSNFEKVVPNYYFRRTRDGRISNGSGCSNDIATERPMVRKLIVDACVYWLQEYGIDGYRFDLMGLMDVTTMKAIEKEVKAIKPNFMLYGEGWNMMTVLPHEQKAMMDNAHLLPTYGFFNDSFREIVKGGSFEDKLREPGYVLGAGHYRLGFKFAYVGSCVNLIFPAKFTNAKQSINYVECHDNGTLFDKIAISNAHEDEATRLKRVMLANAAVMLAFGVPFFHRGQEIGLSKFGDSNSYKSGDKINKFDYSILDERGDMAHYFSALTQLRKDCPFLRITDQKAIEKMVEFEDLDHDGILIDYVDAAHLAPYKKFKVIINPSTETLFYALEDYQKIIFNSAGYAQAKMDTFVKNLMVAPVSLLIVGLRADEISR